MEIREIGGENITIAASLDAVGLYCPMPIILLKTELDKAKSNQVVEILADDSSFHNDLISWCKLTNHNILSVTRDEEGFCFAYVQKN